MLSRYSDLVRHGRALAHQRRLLRVSAALAASIVIHSMIGRRPCFLETGPLALMVAKAEIQLPLAPSRRSANVPICPDSAGQTIR
jgi:hypothetical protein